MMTEEPEKYQNMLQKLVFKAQQVNDVVIVQSGKLHSLKNINELFSFLLCHI